MYGNCICLWCRDWIQSDSQLAHFPCYKGAVGLAAAQHSPSLPFIDGSEVSWCGALFWLFYWTEKLRVFFANESPPVSLEYLASCIPCFIISKPRSMASEHCVCALFFHVCLDSVLWQWSRDICELQ